MSTIYESGDKKSQNNQSQNQQQQSHNEKLPNHQQLDWAPVDNPDSSLNPELNIELISDSLFFNSSANKKEKLNPQRQEKGAKFQGDRVIASHSSLNGSFYFNSADAVNEENGAQQNQQQSNNNFSLNVKTLELQEQLKKFQEETQGIQYEQQDPTTRAQVQNPQQPLQSPEQLRKIQGNERRDPFYFNYIDSLNEEKGAQENQQQSNNNLPFKKKKQSLRSQLKKFQADKAQQKLTHQEDQADGRKVELESIEKIQNMKIKKIKRARKKGFPSIPQHFEIMNYIKNIISDYKKDSSTYEFSILGIFYRIKIGLKTDVSYAAITKWIQKDSTLPEEISLLKEKIKENRKRLVVEKTKESKTKVGVCLESEDNIYYLNKVNEFFNSIEKEFRIELTHLEKAEIINVPRALFMHG